MYAFGQFEDVAYRVFEKDCHMESFLSGMLRFGSLTYYTRTESLVRRDSSEGVSHFLVGSVENTGEYISSQVYALCFHRTLESARQSKLGKHIVEVRNPLKLAELATSKMQSLGHDFVGGIEGVLVEYNKGEEFYSRPEQLELARLIYSQKPRDPFELENEFRMVIISRENLGEHFELDLESKLNFTRKIENL